MESIRLVNIRKMGRNKENRKISSDQGTGWTIQGFISPRSSSFTRLRNVQTALGLTQPPIEWALGVSFAEAKETGV